MSIDEATTSYRATEKLLLLYQAYAVTSRANGMVLDRMIEKLPGLDNLNDDEKEAVRTDLAARINLSRESWNVWANNYASLRVRLSELKEFTP